MKVIDYVLHHWFLFQNEGQYYLYGNFSHNSVVYQHTIELNEYENSQYKENGREYIISLVEEIQKACPILKDSTSLYKERKVKNSIITLATELVHELQNPLLQI